MAGPATTSSMLCEAAFPVGVFVATTLAVAWLLLTKAQRDSLLITSRLKAIEADSAVKQRKVHWRWLTDTFGLENAFPGEELGATESGLEPLADGNRSVLQERLIHAGIRSRQAVRRFLFIRTAIPTVAVAMAFSLWILGYLNFFQASVFGIFFGLAGTVVPGFWLLQRVTQRRMQLRNEFADFLDLFVACVESGMSMQEMLKVVSEEMQETHPDLATELAVGVQQMELGHSLEATIADLASRTGVDELRSFYIVVRQSLQVGSSIGTALQELASSLRSTRELRAEEQAQKASVKILLPTMVFIFPAVFVILAGPAAIEINKSILQAPAVDSR